MRRIEAIRPTTRKGSVSRTWSESRCTGNPKANCCYQAIAIIEG
jgi:hypothetical protein